MVTRRSCRPWYRSRSRSSSAPQGLHSVLHSSAVSENGESSCYAGSRIARACAGERSVSKPSAPASATAACMKSCSTGSSIEPSSGEPLPPAQLARHPVGGEVREVAAQRPDGPGVRQRHQPRPDGVRGHVAQLIEPRHIPGPIMGPESLRLVNDVLLERFGAESFDALRKNWVGLGSSQPRLGLAIASVVAALEFAFEREADRLKARNSVEPLARNALAARFVHRS
jgi:hypothetical protein